MRIAASEQLNGRFQLTDRSAPHGRNLRDGYDSFRRQIRWKQRKYLVHRTGFDLDKRPAETPAAYPYIDPLRKPTTGPAGSNDSTTPEAK
jgi:hypothetical protein